jgi:allantoinase
MLIVRSTRLVLPHGVRPATLQIEDGVIQRIGEYHGADPTGADVFNAGDLVVSPGLVDTHVHINEPGRTAWEGFDSATRAAAAGGVTTLVDMPLNSVPATTTAAAYQAKVDAARAQCHVDVGFWGGVVPGNVGDLDALVDAGVLGFKCFLVPSGVDEFPAVSESDLRRAMPLLARRAVPLLVHAEDPAHIVNPRYSAEGPGANPQPYGPYLASRPVAAEVEAVRMMIRLSAASRARTHIVHVSSAEAVDLIEAAKTDHVPITAETCPHYLTFAAEEIPSGATEFKCAPPIRDTSHRCALWRGLASGALDLVVTDHSPAPPPLKTPGDFARAWGGIASLELSLPAVATGLTAQRSTRGSSPASLESSELMQLAQWMSAAPAALAGLSARKGRIAPGMDADLTVWDPAASFVVDPLRLQQRHKVTPYAGSSLSGTVLTTFVRGERVWDRNRLVQAYGGQLL